MARQERSDVGNGRRSAFGESVATDGLRGNCPCDVPDPVRSGLMYPDPRLPRHPVRRINDTIRRRTFEHTQPRRHQRGYGVILRVIVDIFDMCREADIIMIGSVDHMRRQPVGTNIVAVRVKGPANEIET